MKISSLDLMATDATSPGVNIYIILGVLGTVALILTVLGCAWCRRKWREFKERRNPVFSNPLQIATTSNDFSSFPAQLNAQLATTIPDYIVFEPLPEIRSRNLQAVSQNIRPARFTGDSGRISLQDWFDESQINFPRNQLKYLREVGCAWYGQAVEGEAYNIDIKEKKTQIVVKILRVDATVLEYMQFLHEARALRELRHPHLLRLVGRCLEVHPFLLVMEHCSIDLKTHLIQQRTSSDKYLKDGTLLRIAHDISSALLHMHEHGYVHSDIATHSCLMTDNLVIKIGDYGTALFVHKSDYYCLGDIAFPLRWCAPESLHGTASIIEAKTITREANVWSMGVLLWELLEFGKLPYMDYTDDEVVQNVIIDDSLKLEQPKAPCIHNDMIYNVMQLCWLSAEQRPPMEKIVTLLSYLYDNKDAVPESVDFESRWNSLQPVIRSHNLPCLTSTPSVLRFESDFHSRNDFGPLHDGDSVASADYITTHGDKSPTCGSFSGVYGGSLCTEISPSLQNLRGSIENLTTGSSSTCEGDIEISKPSRSNHEEDDDDDVEKTITEAIRDLDRMLAAEISQSETSKSSTPEKGPTDTQSGDSIDVLSSSPDSEPIELSDFENMLQRNQHCVNIQMACVHSISPNESTYEVGSGDKSDSFEVISKSVLDDKSTC